MKENYSNLVAFVAFMDKYFEKLETSIKVLGAEEGLRKALNMDKYEHLVWNHSEDNAHKIISSL